MKPREFANERVQRVWDSVYAAAYAAEFYSQHDAARQGNAAGLDMNDSIGGLLQDMGERIAQVAIMIADAAVANLERVTDYE